MQYCIQYGGAQYSSYRWRVSAHVTSVTCVYRAKVMVLAMSSAVSLTMDAYRRLREDIIHGRIRPNQHLVAANVAERLEISRTPVREALHLLASEGLVEATTRGFVVREHTTEEIRQIYQVRAALEDMAARLTAENASDEAIATIESIGAHDTCVVDHRTVLSDRNAEFHQAIMQAAGNPRLAQINQRNSEQFFNHRIAHLYTSEEAAAAVAGHHRILDAIKSRDPDRAAYEARQHVLDALPVTLRVLR